MPTVKGHKFFTDDTYDCSKLDVAGHDGLRLGSGVHQAGEPIEKKEVLPDQPVDVSSVRPAG